MKTIAKVSWKSPSNIAFIKYWGKTGNQVPLNASLSLTLEKCFTSTSIEVKSLLNHGNYVSFNFLFAGKENDEFSNRIGNYLNRLIKELPVLGKYHFLIESENSFPHSAGIASSASAMSALALCLLTIEQRLGEKILGDFYQEASRLARLGSGSASRSIYGEYTTWGKIENINGTSDEFASPLNFKPHPLFLCMRDTVLIIDSEKKKISSSIGHALMEGHPYSNQRFVNASQNLKNLLKVMQNGDFNAFSQILELEALSIHAMMMTANPWYTLLAPNTLPVIQRIRDFRSQTGTKITFTLDAGANVHVIYPAEVDEKVKDFITNELLKFTNNNSLILDNIGLGPELLIDEIK